MAAWWCAEGHATSTRIDHCIVCGRRKPEDDLRARVEAERANEWRER